MIHHIKWAIAFTALIWIGSESKGQSTKNSIYDTPLWEISGKGLKTSSYLFGSLHILPASWLDSFPVIKEKLVHAPVYAGERNLLLPPQTSQVPVPTEKTDTPLIKSLSPEQFQFLDSFLKVNFQGASLHDPEAINMNMIDLLGIVGQYLATKQLKTINQNAKNLDYHLQELANQAGNKMEGLETESNLNKLYIEAHDTRQSVANIIYILKNADQAAVLQQAIQIKDQYLSLHIDYEFDHGSGNDAIVEQRNRLWLPKIISLLQTNSCFIHVGIGHLQYKEGLINLLRKAGYTVKPVSVRQ